MAEFIEQRSCVKFCVANEISCAETLRMLQKAFKNNCMSKTQAYEWYKSFKEGRTVVEDLPRTGRPSTSIDDDHVNKVKQIVLQNRRVSAREIARDIGIPKTSVHRILTDILQMARVSARIVPKELNFLQKQRRMDVANEMLSVVQNDSTFMKRIITGDETWVYEYDMETEQQSSEWVFPGEPKLKKPRQSKSKIKALLTVFFDYRGVVHYEFLPTGKTVNKEYYLEVMRRLCNAIRRKRPDLWVENSWILHHDNAPAHTSMLIRNYLAKHSTNMAPQAPYSPDMAPCDFFLFPKLKLPLRGKRFETLEAVKENATKELKAIPISAYEKCFKDWLKRWHMCIASNGDYFEGDKINLDD
jgi:hypothetical protein